MPKRKLDEKLTKVHKSKLTKVNHADYAAESPPPVAYSAHTNKLMIIAKESTTQQITQQRK